MKSPKISVSVMLEVYCELLIGLQCGRQRHEKATAAVCMIRRFANRPPAPAHGERPSD